MVFELGRESKRQKYRRAVIAEIRRNGKHATMSPEGKKKGGGGGVEKGDSENGIKTKRWHTAENG